MTLVRGFDHVADKQMIGVPGQIIGGQQTDYLAVVVHYRQTPYLLILHNLSSVDKQLARATTVDGRRHDVACGRFIGVPRLGHASTSDVTVGDHSQQQIIGNYWDTTHVFVSHDLCQLPDGPLRLDRYNVS